MPARRPTATKYPDDPRTWMGFHVEHSDEELEAASLRWWRSDPHRVVDNELFAVTVATFPVAVYRILEIAGNITRADEDTRRHHYAGQLLAGSTPAWRPPSPRTPPDTCAPWPSRSWPAGSSSPAAARSATSNRPPTDERAEVLDRVHAHPVGSRDPHGRARSGAAGVVGGDRDRGLQPPRTPPGAGHSVQPGSGGPGALGADYLWWFLDPTDACFGMLVQAKRLTRTRQVEGRHPPQGRQAARRPARHCGSARGARRCTASTPVGSCSANRSLLPRHASRTDASSADDAGPRPWLPTDGHLDDQRLPAEHGVVHPKTTADLVLTDSLPLEDLVDPDLVTGAVWDMNLREIPPGQLRDFLLKPQGRAAPARSLAASSACLRPKAARGLLRRGRRAAPRSRRADLHRRARGPRALPRPVLPPRPTRPADQPARLCGDPSPAADRRRAQNPPVHPRREQRTHRHGRRHTRRAPATAGAARQQHRWSRPGHPVRPPAGRPPSSCSHAVNRVPTS